MDPVYQQIPQKQEVDTSYHQVPEHSPNPSTQVLQPQKRRRSRIFLHWLWHIISLLWLAPIATLLYLNFSHYIIGASAWCPKGHCDAENYSDSAVSRAQQLDRRDHDLNGALQFVAKALEVWFMFVATSLLYDIGVLFAKKGRGLPVGYLLTHVEFSDIRYIFSPLLWTSPLPHPHAEKRSGILKLYIFAFVTMLLTILANLMGPAAAVLVLPTFQWIDTPHISNETFLSTNVMYQPFSDNVFPGCDASQLIDRNYSCNADLYGPSMDEFTAQALSSVKQYWSSDDGDFVLASSQEESLQFAFNNTAQGALIWVSNRQVLRGMSHEYYKTVYEEEPPNYASKRNITSLQTMLRRQGPSLGVQSNCYAGNVTQLELEDGGWVRCYTGWTPYFDPSRNYTKCLRLGMYNDTSQYAAFDLGTDEFTGVGVYFADKATYFNETDDFQSGVKSCLTNETSVACDWDHVFETSYTLLPVELKNTSINVGIVSYQVPGVEYEHARVWCDHVTYQSFPEYSVDTSLQSNPQHLVTMNQLPENGTDPLIVNPDWFLAALSVDNEGSLRPTRQIARELYRTLPAAYELNNLTYESKMDYDEFITLHLYMLGQSMSLVNYNSTAPMDPNSAESKQADKDHRIFRTWATNHVWAYGISGRTSKLGVAVVSLGSFFVLLRFFLGLKLDVEERSTVEVLAAAFKHHHQGEFEGLEGESHLARVRYRIHDDGDGGQKFLPEKRAHRWSHIHRK